MNTLYQHHTAFRCFHSISKIPMDTSVFLVRLSRINASLTRLDAPISDYTVQYHNPSRDSVFMTCSHFTTPISTAVDKYKLRRTSRHFIELILCVGVITQLFWATRITLCVRYFSSVNKVSLSTTFG